LTAWVEHLHDVDPGVAQDDVADAARIRTNVCEMRRREDARVDIVIGLARAVMSELGQLSI
jgi:hypothetical protein